MLKRLAVLAIAIGIAVATTFAAGPTFKPDAVFSGSALTGWTQLGSATWTARNGEIIGTPRTPAGGWLILNQGFQDLGFFSHVTCDAGCTAGVLMRAEKTAAGGLKGILLQLSDGMLRSFAVVLDGQGAEVSRAPIMAGGRGGGGPGRFPPQPGAVTSGFGGPPAPLPQGVNLPAMAARNSAYQAGQPNAIDVNMTYAGYSVRMNGAGANGAAGAITDEMGKYGAIALYVGGAAPARFKDVAYSDLTARPMEAEKLSPNFRAQRLSEFYYSYASEIADVNRDGNLDVIAGPYYYLGPEFSVAREIYVPDTFQPTSQYSLPSMVQIAHDFTGDGWPDVLNMSGNAGVGTGTLFVNPKGERRRWDSSVVMRPPDTTVGGEETLLRDIDGDGSKEIVHTGNGWIAYSKPDPANPTGPWVTTRIADRGPWGINQTHGMGVGDVNSDGRIDYVSPWGWFEQPPKGSTALWTYHPAELGRNNTGGAEMGVYDVNGDGLTDVVTALEAHGFGLAWYEQKRDAAGNRTFVPHMIMDTPIDNNAGGVFFTQPHGTGFADINMDGVQDFIVGKRHHSHFDYADPDNFGMPVLYVYKVQRNPRAPGGAEFVPELVSNRSGVGSHFAVADLNKDGTPDITVSAASGTFIFFNNTRRGAR